MVMIDDHRKNYQLLFSLSSAHFYSPLSLLITLCGLKIIEEHKIDK